MMVPPPSQGALQALPGSTVPSESLHLFWSWPKPVTIKDEADARRAVATILMEGTAEDWRRLDLAAIAPIVDELPLFGGAKRLWATVCRSLAQAEPDREPASRMEKRPDAGADAAILPDPAATVLALDPRHPEARVLLDVYALLGRCDIIEILAIARAMDERVNASWLAKTLAVAEQADFSLAESPAPASEERIKDALLSAAAKLVLWALRAEME